MFYPQYDQEVAKNFRTVEEENNDSLAESFKEQMVNMQGNLMDGFELIANKMQQMEGKLDQSQADMHDLTMTPQKRDIEENRAMFAQLQEMIKGQQKQMTDFFQQSQQQEAPDRGEANKNVVKGNFA